MSESKIPERAATNFFRNSLPQTRVIFNKMRYIHLHGFDTFFEKKLPPVLAELGYEITAVTEEVETDVDRLITSVRTSEREIVEIRFLKVRPALERSILNFFGIGYGAACALFLSPTSSVGVFTGVLGILINLYNNRDILSKGDPRTKDLLEVFVEIGRTIIENPTKPVATLAQLESRFYGRFDRNALNALLDNLLQRKLIKYRARPPEGYLYSSASVDDIREYVADVYGSDVALEDLDHTRTHTRLD